MKSPKDILSEVDIDILELKIKDLKNADQSEDQYKLNRNMRKLK